MTLPCASTPWTWNTDLAMSRPIVLIACMLGSSDSGALTAPTFMALTCRWRSRPQHHERTHAPQQKIVIQSSCWCEQGASEALRKQNDRLAAVSPKSDQVFITRRREQWPSFRFLRQPSYAPNSLRMQNDHAFRDGRCGGASFAGVLTDPIPCHPNALVGAGLVLVDGHREPAASGADQGIAHKTLDRPDELVHFRLALLENVHQLLRALA